MLVLIRDLASRGDLKSSSVLQVVGLTPAVARLAATVGPGHSVIRLCTDNLRINEATARSTSRTVCRKVEIGKQSESSGIVVLPG
ncbi:hypothetical protein LOM8899_01089 [Flavimaricola marinus]|uniref:Uncharacterized protein n=1 Tax=Flavimaricola marinus TaxID=1819565 RepID=A0A238LBA5_9RHOB|nr:hypothetical protein LOM8899_01089 [Flavimaricola marinus]